MDELTAVDALKKWQKQLDPDGIEVGVSRHALDEVLADYDRLTAELEQVKADMKIAKFFDKSDSLTEESVRNTAEIKRLEAERDRRGNLLEDVVNEVAEVGQFFYTTNGLYLEPEPAAMVRKALELKDREIAALKAGLLPIKAQEGK